MIKRFFIISLLFTCISCSFNDYDKLINNESTAVNSGEPGVTITYPADGEYIQTQEKSSSGDIVLRKTILSGYANDGYSKPITDDSAFTWSSNIAGELGNGRELELEQGKLIPGTHRITLTCRDSWGKTDSRTATVYMPHIFTEDFNQSTFELKQTYCNLSKTTGRWDTANGSIHLSPYLKYESPGRCYTEKTYDVAVKDGYAYIVPGSTLEFSNKIVIQNINNPSSTYTYNTGEWGKVSGVAVSGNYVYFADADPIDGGLYIFDISNPSSPSLVGVLHKTKISLPLGLDSYLPLTAADVAIDNNYAYVANFTFDPESLSMNMVIIDISNKTEPKFKSKVDIGLMPAVGVAVSGNYAYLACTTNGLVIVDISNPGSPAKKGTYDTTSALGVSVSGNYAYIADGTSGLIIVDITNPDSPVYTGRFNTDDEARGVTVSNGYAYIADSFSGLIVLDISEPSYPVYAGRYNTAGTVRELAISGNYAYLADEEKGVYLVNISNPADIPLLGTYNTSGLAQRITVDNNYAYVADNKNGLVILDICNPVTPRSAGRFYRDAITPVLDVAVSSGFAYVAYSFDGLVVADINDPLNPAFVWKHDGGSIPACGVAVNGEYIYVAYSLDGLVIIKNMGSRSYQLIKCFNTPGDAQDVAVNGSYAYVADSENGLVIVDISNPADPIETDTYDTTLALGVAVKDNYAYIADGTNGLLILDITDPDNIEYKGWHKTDGEAMGVEVLGNYAYIADFNKGLIIVDITDPGAPVLANRHDTISASGVAVNSNYSFVVDLYEGLQIIGNIKPYRELFNTYTEQEIRSNPIPVETSVYSNARFFIKGSSNNQFLIMEMSNDNGTTWLPVSDTLLIPMHGSQSSLIWRARMNSINRYVSPVVEKICIEYWD